MVDVGAMRITLWLSVTAGLNAVVMHRVSYLHNIIILS